MKYLDKVKKVAGCQRIEKLIIVNGQSYGIVNECEFCPVSTCKADLRYCNKVMDSFTNTPRVPGDCPLPDLQRGIVYPRWTFPERNRDWFRSRIGTGEKIYHLPVSFTCPCKVCGGWRQQGYIASEIPVGIEGIRPEWYADYYHSSQDEHGGFFPSLEEYYENYPLMRRER